jgi:hypothetical protein
MIMDKCEVVPGGKRGVVTRWNFLRLASILIK